MTSDVPNPATVDGNPYAGYTYQRFADEGRTLIFCYGCGEGLAEDDAAVLTDRADEMRSYCARCADGVDCDGFVPPRPPTDVVPLCPPAELVVLHVDLAAARSAAQLLREECDGGLFVGEMLGAFDQPINDLLVALGLPRPAR